MLPGKGVSVSSTPFESAGSPGWTPGSLSAKGCTRNGPPSMIDVSRCQFLCTSARIQGSGFWPNPFGCHRSYGVARMGSCRRRSAGGCLVGNQGYNAGYRRGDGRRLLGAIEGTTICVPFPSIQLRSCCLGEAVTSVADSWATVRPLRLLCPRVVLLHRLRPGSPQRAVHGPPVPHSRICGWSRRLISPLRGVAIRLLHSYPPLCQEYY